MSSRSAVNCFEKHFKKIINFSFLDRRNPVKVNISGLVPRMCQVKVGVSNYDHDDDETAVRLYE